MRVRTIVGLLLAGPLAGCSFLFTSGPPPPTQRGEAFACTTFSVAPVLDLTWAGYGLAAASAERRDGIGGGDIALASVWIGSAAYGIWNIIECRKAINEANRRAPGVTSPSLLSIRTPVAPLPHAWPPTWSAPASPSQRAPNPLDLR